MNTSDLFKQEVAKVPIDVKLELDLSFAIADKIDAILKRKGMSQKEFGIKQKRRFLVGFLVLTILLSRRLLK